MELSGANDKNFKVPDFLEATIYTKEDAVIMVGNFEDADTSEKRSKVKITFSFYFFRSTTSPLGTDRGSTNTPKAFWIELATSTFQFKATCYDTIAQSFGFLSP
jgi:hypothetical protein